MAKSIGAFSGGVKKVLRRIPGIKGLLNRINLAENRYACATEQINSLNTRITNAEAHIGSLFDQLAFANNKIAEQQNVIEALKDELCNLVSNEQKNAITQRFIIKSSNNLPINIAFLVEEPSVIKNILSVVEELHRDERFDVMLVNLWYKSYKKDGYTYVRPDIESVIDTSVYNVIESYDPESGHWLDLECLLPDYVFFSRPYDFYRNEAFYIGEVSKYARTCYVPYCIQTIGGEVEKLLLTPECNNLHYFFVDNSIRIGIVKEILGESFADNGRAVFKGYPGIDMLKANEQIKHVQSDRFNVLWTPRWNNGENNCHFFEYWKVLADYAKDFDDCSIIFRPHPLCFNNFLNRGELTEEELENVRKAYSNPNEIDESSNYIDAFSRSSVLVADETSMIAEYFLTEKPIIFCKKETHFSLLMDRLVEGCYVVSNEDELIEKLNFIKSGNDPLKDKRIELTRELLTNYSNTAAINIKQELLDDFSGKNL